MFKFIKNWLDYRAKYYSSIETVREASKNALEALGRYEALCASLPEGHHLSSQFQWKEYADQRMMKENEELRRTIRKLNQANSEMYTLWQESIFKYLKDPSQKWMPIEIAPKDGQNILVYGAWPIHPTMYDFAFARWDLEQNFWAFDGEEMFVSHWMPLPEPPK